MPGPGQGAWVAPTGPGIARAASVTDSPELEVAKLRRRCSPSDVVLGRVRVGPGRVAGPWPGTIGPPWQGAAAAPSQFRFEFSAEEDDMIKERLGSRAAADRACHWAPRARDSDGFLRSPDAGP